VGSSGRRSPDGVPGSPPHGPTEEAPIDVAALHADDALINLLADGDLRGAAALGPDPADPLVALLSDWVREVAPERVPAADPGPVPGAGVPEHRRTASPRYLLRLAVAAAATVALLAGVDVGASTAEPGDPLWSVATVLHVERTRSVHAAAEVTAKLDRARAALQQGNSAAAARELAEIEVPLAVVRTEEGRADLDHQRRLLAAELIGFLPAATALVQAPDPGHTALPGDPTSAATTSLAAATGSPGDAETGAATAAGASTTGTAAAAPSGPPAPQTDSQPDGSAGEPAPDATGTAPTSPDTELAQPAPTESAEPAADAPTAGPGTDGEAEAPPAQEPSAPVQQPEQPAEPNAPTEPEQPTEPSTPTEPEQPTEPSTPTEPVQPTEPSTPTEPEQPAGPGHPVHAPTHAEGEPAAEPGDTQDPSAPPATAEPATAGTEPADPAAVEAARAADST
jgi:hypothetical protein